MRAASAPTVDGNAVAVVGRDRAGRVRILTVRGETQETVAMETGVEETEGTSILKMRNAPKLALTMTLAVGPVMTRPDAIDN